MKTLVIDTFTTIDEVAENLREFKMRMIKNGTEVGNFSFQLKVRDQFEDFRKFLELRESDCLYYNEDFSFRTESLSVILRSRDLLMPFYGAIQEIKRKIVWKLNDMGLDHESILGTVQPTNLDIFSRKLFLV